MGVDDVGLRGLPKTLRVGILNHEGTPTLHDVFVVLSRDGNEPIWDVEGDGEVDGG